MKTNTTRTVAVVLSVLSLLCASILKAQPKPEPMTETTVYQMLKANVSPEVIILAISKCEPHFSLMPAVTNVLLDAGMTDQIYKALAARQAGKPVNIPTTTLPTETAATPAPPTVPPTPQSNGKPRVYMGSRSHGNTWNARRNQAMELAKDFERDCPDVRITVNDQTADYFVRLNHIEVGFLARDNQIQVSNSVGDVLTAMGRGFWKGSDSIKGGSRKACAIILTDWSTKQH